jgi:hypothetical protein
MTGPEPLRRARSSGALALLAWIPTESESPDGRIRQGIHSTQQFDPSCQIE